MTFSVSPDDSGQLNKAVEAITKKLGNPFPLYASWANYLDRQIQLSFENEAVPIQGTAWAPLSPLTLKAKAKKKGSINKVLQDTGTLRDTAAAQVLSDGVAAGSNQQVGEYSLGAIHQFGTKDGKIPARRWLPMTESATSPEVLPEVWAEFAELAADFLK